MPCSPPASSWGQTPGCQWEGSRASVSHRIAAPACWETPRTEGSPDRRDGNPPAAGEMRSRLLFFARRRRKRARSGLHTEQEWQRAQRVRGFRLPQTSGQDDWAMMVVIIAEIVAA